MITKEQWAKVAEALSHPYGGGAKFRIDGHDINLSVEKSGKRLSYCIVAYVDGFIKGEYFKPDSAIGAKFYRPRNLSIYSAKDIARLTKLWGKREAAKMVKKGRYLHHDCTFPSAESARRTWAKTCSSIELVRVGFEQSQAAEGPR